MELEEDKEVLLILQRQHHLSYQGRHGIQNNIKDNIKKARTSLRIQLHIHQNNTNHPKKKRGLT